MCEFEGLCELFDSKNSIKINNRRENLPKGQRQIKKRFEVSDNLKEKNTTENMEENHFSEVFYKISDISRKYRKLRGAEIILEGLIGVGKSTLGESLTNFLNKNGLKAKFFPEFRNDLLLALYIKDMKKYAFSFQTIIAQIRLSIYKESLEFSSTGGISIIDRGLMGDFTFAKMQKENGFFSDEEFEVYLNLIKSEDKPEPFLTLFLDCSPEKAFERMNKRHIESEISGYTLDYFQKLNENYFETLNLSSKKYKVIRMDWEKDSNINSNLDDKTCKNVLDYLIESLNL